VKVAIAGAGKVGSYIADDLIKAGHHVLLIEKEPAVVERLRLELPAEYHLSDACEISELHEAGLADVDVMVAATGEDQVNLVVSLLAKQEFAVPRVVARVNHPKNQWLFNETWGVDVSVSTPHLLTALVEEAVSVGSLVRILSFEGDRARLSEVKLAPTSPAIGKDLQHLEFPRGSTVVAVLRGEHLVVPRGDTVFHEGDEVMVLVTDDSEEKVRAVLIG
jgi:trk system potassium uptake protein TrkA